MSMRADTGPWQSEFRGDGSSPAWKDATISFGRDNPPGSLFWLRGRSRTGAVTPVLWARDTHDLWDEWLSMTASWQGDPGQLASWQAREEKEGKRNQASMAAAQAPEKGLRIGDDERTACLAKLEEHYVKGRLELGEWDERSASALAGRFQADLDELLSDLPVITASVSDVQKELRLKGSGKNDVASRKLMPGRTALSALAAAVGTVAVLLVICLTILL